MIVTPPESTASPRGAEDGPPAPDTAPDGIQAHGWTLAVGRFLVHLPPGASAAFGRQGFNEAGAFIRALPVAGRAGARAQVEAQAALLRVPHEEGGTRLVRVVEGHGACCWFLYFWKDTAFKDETLEVMGYFWNAGRLFIFRSACRADAAAMTRQAGRLDALFRRLRRRSPWEIPPGPAFCLGEAYFPGHPAPGSEEHIELLAGFTGRPGMRLRFCTDTVGELIAHYPPLLEREALGWSRPRLRGGVRVRARERPVGPFAGQELVERTGLPGPAGGWSFVWECLGRPRNPLRPLIRLELRVGAGIEAEAVGLWDGVLDSLRRRDKDANSLRLPGSFRSSWSL